MTAKVNIRKHSVNLRKLFVHSNASTLHRIAMRSFLSESYRCEEAWQKRLESPLLKNINIAQHFVDTDKKFGTKNLASGVDVDLFANCVQEESELEELEHLLYRFRRTKRATEMMGSTTYATIKAFLKFKQYDALFRILNDRVNYGVFPDMYSYNVLMDTFLEEKLYKEAAHVAVLMMLQEDFSNPIGPTLSLYVCQMFVNECSFDSWLQTAKNGENEEKPSEDGDDEEVTLQRVPYVRNPWFDDHFDIKNPKHLIGKTFYLNGCQIDDNLGWTYRLLGLSMYEKWEKLSQVLEDFLNSNIQSHLLSEGVAKIKEEINCIAEEEMKDKIISQFEYFDKQGKVIEGTFIESLSLKLKQLTDLEKQDIEQQKSLFTEWEKQREVAFNKEHKMLDRERRLKIIADKKEYLYWKEKLLFFFENEVQIQDELKEVEEIIAKQKSKVSVEEAYEPPEIMKKPIVKLSKLRRMARVKAL